MVRDAQAQRSNYTCPYCGAPQRTPCVIVLKDGTRRPRYRLMIHQQRAALEEKLPPLASRRYSSPG